MGIEREGVCSVRATSFIAEHSLPRVRYDLFHHFRKCGEGRPGGEALEEQGIAFKYDYKRYGSMPECGYTTFIFLPPVINAGRTRPSRKPQQICEEAEQQIELPAGCLLVPLYPEHTLVSWDLLLTAQLIEKVMRTAIAQGLANPQRGFLLGHCGGRRAIFDRLHELSDRIAGALLLPGVLRQRKDLLFFNCTHGRSGFRWSIPHFAQRLPPASLSVLDLSGAHASRLIHRINVEHISRLYEELKGDAEGAVPELFQSDVYDLRVGAVGAAGDAPLAAHLRRLADGNFERRADVDAFLIYVDSRCPKRAFYNAAATLLEAEAPSPGLLLYYREPSGRIIIRTQNIGSVSIGLDASRQMRSEQSVKVDGVVRVYAGLVEKSSTYLAQLRERGDPFLATGIELRINIAEHKASGQTATRP